MFRSLGIRSVVAQYFRRASAHVSSVHQFRTMNALAKAKQTMQINRIRDPVETHQAMSQMVETTVNGSDKFGKGGKENIEIRLKETDEIVQIRRLDHLRREDLDSDSEATKAVIANEG